MIKRALLSSRKTFILSDLTLSTNTFNVGNAQGTFVGYAQNPISGSTVAFNSLSVAGSLQLAQVMGLWQIQVGPSAPGSPTTITFNLVETNPLASNSPHTTSGLSVIESAAAANSTPYVVLLAA